MNKKKIEKLIKNEKWEVIVNKFPIDSLCRILCFKEIMHLINKMFFGNILDDKIQQFAISLAFEVKKHFTNEWEEDWKNDVFLGHLCSVLWRYNDQYKCYKNAFDKLSDPPESLLLLLAGCDATPDFIPPEPTEKYLEKALEKKLTSEGALMMRSLYKKKSDRKLEEFWDNKYHELEKANIHTETIIPKALIEN